MNSTGQLIGINSQILTPGDGNIGLGFAIPSNMAKNVMDQLIENGAVRRAKLGVTVQGLSADMASSLGLSVGAGALVSNVDEGLPAARAGIKQGDVITQYNGKPSWTATSCATRCRARRPARPSRCSTARRAQRHHQSDAGRARPRSAKADRAQQRHSGGKFGMTVQPLTPELADEAACPALTQGVIVTDLDPEGIAADSGLQEGDVIVKVNGRPGQVG